MIIYHRVMEVIPQAILKEPQYCSIIIYNLELRGDRGDGQGWCQYWNQRVDRASSLQRTGVRLTWAWISCVVFYLIRNNNFYNNNDNEDPHDLKRYS